jgi:phosphatidylglycerophosphate synthase
MLDGWAKRRIDPLMDVLAVHAASTGVSANQITVISFAIGLAGAAAIAVELYLLGLLLVLVSRIGDGLDGAVARLAGATDVGGYLDIVLDFAVYGAVPLAFVIANPEANALAGAVLLLAFYVNGTSFLAFSAVAAKRGMSSEERGSKSIYFTTGLAEASETIIFFVIICLFPDWFAPLALAFAAMCLWTAFWRVRLAARSFGEG